MKNCFKKILTIFIMVLTIISVGIMNNEITANAATIGDQLLQPEDGWKRYDDNDDKIIYSDLNTGEYSGHGISGPSSNGTYTQFTKGTCQFNFKGSKIRIIGLRSFHGGYNGYSDKVKVEIDNVSVEFYSNVGSAQFQTILYENTGLSNSEHCVKISNEDVLMNTSINVDCIDVDGYLIGDEDNSLSLDKSSLTLNEGDFSKLTATTTPSSIDIDWSSSDNTVATVDSNGNIRGIKEGQAIITSTIKGTNINATCLVRVTKKDIVPEQGNPEQEYIVNNAYAKGDNTNNANGQVSIIFKGIAEAQLKVVKTADVDSVYVGDNFTYTIEVTNTSNKVAKNVIVNDNAPNHIQFIPSKVITTQGKVDSSSTSKNIVVNVGDIAPLGKVIIKIPVLVVE